MRSRLRAGVAAALALWLMAQAPPAAAAAAALAAGPLPVPSPVAAAAMPVVPDFSGVWMPVGTPAALRPEDGLRVPLLPDGERLYAERQAARGPQRNALDGMARCLPPGVPRIYLQRMPFEVQQEASAVNVLFQWNRQVRVVELDGARNGAPYPGPAYEGHARGRFIGADLRVDTTEFNDATWLDDSGLPHSAKLHTIERWWMDEGGQRLNIDFEIDDPVYYSEIWKFNLSFRRLPRATAIEEDVCVERQGMVTQPQSTAPATPARLAAPRPAAPRAATAPRPASVPAPASQAPRR